MPPQGSLANDVNSKALTSVLSLAGATGEGVHLRVWGLESTWTGVTLPSSATLPLLTKPRALCCVGEPTGTLKMLGQSCVMRLMVQGPSKAEKLVSMCSVCRPTCMRAVSGFVSLPPHLSTSRSSLAPLLTALQSPRLLFESLISLCLPRCIALLA